MRILLVEDDRNLAQLLQRRLATDGVTVVHAPTVAEGQLLTEADAFTAVILDLQLPDGTGLEVLRLLRAQDHAVPVLVLSGLDREEVVIRVLDAGADDYVVKPVSLDMLRARLRALVRRGTGAVGAVTRVGALVVDAGRRQVWLDGVPLAVTPLEFALLAHLIAHADAPQTRETLLRDVWGQGYHGGSNVVDVTIMRLRQRLGEAPGTPSIETVRGVGYRLRAPERADVEAGTSDAPAASSDAPAASTTTEALPSVLPAAADDDGMTTG
jgi:two-component system OmpR family response regulator